jgi:hypothetical protein
MSKNPEDVAAIEVTRVLLSRKALFNLRTKLKFLVVFTL